MVFITAGMGGGTGTGAAPVIAAICQELGILTVAVVTTPFNFEGKQRYRSAQEGIRALYDRVDTIIVIPNENLRKIDNGATKMQDAFAFANDVLLAGVKNITDLMTKPGLINLDFADVRTIMSGMGNAIMGTGQCTGEGRAVNAAKNALNNPLLGSDTNAIRTAKGILVNITGGSDVSIEETEEAVNVITSELIDDNANIIFGASVDPSIEGAIRVSIVATGIDMPSALTKK
jgi:cell division protein FtsZ